jgi:hypothetical protein
VPRTTLQIDDVAFKAARAHAAKHRVTLGEAVSTMVRRAAELPRLTHERNGLRVVSLGKRSPRVTADLVNRLLDDAP